MRSPSGCFGSTRRSTRSCTRSCTCNSGRRLRKYSATYSAVSATGEKCLGRCGATSKSDTSKLLKKFFRRKKNKKMSTNLSGVRGPSRHFVSDPFNFGFFVRRVCDRRNGKSLHVIFVRILCRVNELKPFSNFFFFQ